ncbi:hypothetical protein [Streptacidiphilus sp. EB129]|uniref:SCO2584 family spore wall biosynthesis protein n=1 Tax=Streptacidiphilus sp. EB129 TaxID=3156262 RepID=UPI00351625FD
MNPDGFDSSTGDFGGGESDDDAFTGLILDEAFVLAALVHEPSAEERLRALRAGGRRRGGPGGVSRELHYRSDRDEPGGAPADGAGDPYGSRRRGRYQAAPGRWQRVVARMMLVVIGMLAVLVAAAAVYRGSGEGQQPVQRPVTGSSGSTVTAPATAGASH